jgi:hypothetical protein
MAIAESPSLLLREVAGPEGVEAALRLLTGAGWLPELLSAWSSSGRVFELYDPADPGPLGAAIVHARGAGCFELLAWVSVVGFGDPDTSTRLMRGVADALRAMGAERFLVAVGDAQVEHLTALRLAGFRFDRVARDAALACRGDGSRDLVWLDQDL